MMELLFEFSLNVIDFSYILWFYSLLINEKNTRNKFIIAVLLFSSFQFLKDSTLIFGGFSNFIDSAIAVAFLIIYTKKKNFQNFISAIIIESILMLSIVSFVAIALELSINIESTLQFGLSRLLFCILLKMFTILLFYILVKPLKQLYNIMNYGEMRIFSLLLIVSLTCLSYVYGNSRGNEQIFFYTAYLSIILLFVYYMFYLYCKVSKDFANSQTMSAIMEMTKDQIAIIDSEYEQYRKLRHDINNQLSILYDLQKQGHYAEVMETLEKYHGDIEANHSTLTGNIYLDAILRLKIKQYKDISIDLEVMVSKDIPMEGKDIVSLLSNIIDNACEELYKTGDRDFKLSIKGDHSKLQIFAKNRMRSNHALVSEKDTKYHGFGLKIIHEIIEKNDGNIDIKTDDFFTIKILIIF